METTFNGYPNFATWAISLHIENSRELLESWARTAKYTPDKGNLARLLCENYTATKPEFAAPWGDILNAGFASIDWPFVAQVLMDAAKDAVTV